MENKTVSLLLIVLSFSLLVSCGRDAKLSDQLDRLEKQADRAERADKESLARLKSIDERLQAITQQVGANAAHQAELDKQEAMRAEDLPKRLAALESSLQARAQAPPARWAYVDKFRVQRETADLFQNSPLPAEKDPAKDPELAAKLAEYQALRQKSMIWNIPAMVQPAMQKPSPEEMTEIKKKLGELSIALAAYLGREQQGTKLRDAAIQNAFREFPKGRFDLLIDRSFGDNQIYYKADIPVPDVTDQIIIYIRDSQKKP